MSRALALHEDGPGFDPWQLRARSEHSASPFVAQYLLSKKMYFSPIGLYKFENNLN